MDLATLISPETVVDIESVSSKKRALEQLAGLLVDVNSQLAQGQVFDALMERERLGTTALGKGVAIPHCRLPGITRASIALIKIDSGVDYDAPDKSPVDILLALVVPEESTEEHLEILASLAGMLADNRFLAQLRNQQDSESLYHFFLDATGSNRQSAADSDPLLQQTTS